MPLMRRLVALQEYATILHVLAEPVADEPDWMTAIKAKLTNRLARVEAFLATNGRVFPK